MGYYLCFLPEAKTIEVKFFAFEVIVRKRRGKKEPPLRTVDEGLYWALALLQNSRGVQARSSHIRKKARATAVGGVQGLRVGTWLDQAAGGRSLEVQPASGTCLWHFSRACLNMPNLSVIMFGDQKISWRLRRGFQHIWFC